MAGTCVEKLILEHTRYNPYTGELRRVKDSRTGGSIDIICDHVGVAGYTQLRLKGTLYSVHRLAFVHMTGSFPKHSVDHINGDKSDNRWCNLRDATQLDNLRNSAKPSHNTSGVAGVSRCKKKILSHKYGTWEAYVSLNNKKKSLGLYEDFFEAVCSRKSAERKYGFHINHGRAS